MPTSTSHASPTFIQSWSVLIAFGVFLLASAAYILAFRELPISKDTEHWGQLGDYLGGLINPIVGLITIWLLSSSLRQNQLALSQSKLALDQSQAALVQAREELRLTRDAIEQSKQLQIATEAALKLQLQVSEHARDINNAASLFKFANDALQSQERSLRLLPTISDERPRLTEQAQRNRERLDFLSWMMGMELERLKQVYPQKDIEK